MLKVRLRAHKLSRAYSIVWILPFLSNSGVIFIIRIFVYIRPLIVALV